MRDPIDLIASLVDATWKILCAGSVLCLGIVILNRRAQPRPVRQVRRVEQPRHRRAA